MRQTTAAIAAGFALAITASSAQAQISDNVVKIGVLTDMSSLYADATGKGSVVATEMAVADYGGKVKGKPVQVVSADHQNKPDVGVNIARNWYDNDKVDAIFDVPTSSVALPISALTREKNKIHINSGGGSSDITGTQCSPNTVHWTYDTYALSNVAGKAMVKRGEDTWFFVTADYAFGAALERDAASIVKESGG
jgi:branched-chain amino acid transport system substrate-binding protein